MYPLCTSKGVLLIIARSHNLGVKTVLAPSNVSTAVASIEVDELCISDSVS